MFPRRPLPLNPGPTDFWDWLRRRLWRLWCLSQSIKGPSYYHFQRSHCWLLIIFFSSPCRVRQVVQATDLQTCWRWELESLKALWPSSTTRWTFSSPSSQTRWWFTQYTNNGDEHISDSEYDHAYDKKTNWHSKFMNSYWWWCLWWLYTATSTNKAHKALILACWLKIKRQKMVSVWALSEWNHFFSQIIPIKQCCITQSAVSWRYPGLYKVLMRSCWLRKIWARDLLGLFPMHKSGIYCP